MGDEEGNSNRNPNRRMDLNLYLGLPLRLSEPDLGSDLALNSLPVSASEMSSTSHSESYPPTVQEQEAPETLPNEFFEDPYIPSFLPSFASPATVQDSTEGVLNEGSNSNDAAEYVPYSLSAYAPVSLSATPTVQDSESLAQQPGVPHVPYVPGSPTARASRRNESSLQVATGFAPYRPDNTPRRSSLERDGLDRPRLLQNPEVRIQRLIDSNRRLFVRRLRAAVPDDSVEPDDLEGFLPVTDDGGLHDRVVSDTLNATYGGSQKTSEENVDAEGLEEKGTEDQQSGAANFDCNVCLDVAKEPVVTSCGHLFCWPCLYQWLHLHSDHKECPVCKGEVMESNITPIYGRGSSEMDEKKEGEEENSSLKIPPRPRGRRSEGFRQRIRRPVGPFRFIVGEDTQNGEEGPEERSVHGIFNGANSRVLTRLLAARRRHRENSSEHAVNTGGSGSSGSANEAALTPTESNHQQPGMLHGGGSRSTPSALARRVTGLLPRYALYSFHGERYAEIASELSDAVGRMGNNSATNSGASVNPREVRGTSETTAATDQASASSTVAVIQGDNRGQVDAPAEPSSVGSSRTLRRRRRNTVSGSLDVDGEVNTVRKRRRLN
ncbi:hypothetical protein MKW94_017721 [Papaver nudicaule]|uniref:E3 ubiquitin-protein ligase RMA n=1 Tax=Papaver nudicaule TaxID=74823 RepID=A0AA41S965_PAPNU|nr:hypothetical protein [Papaver nudicaule]